MVCNTSDISRDFLWRLISAEGFGGGCNTPVWVQDKAPKCSKDLFLWHHLLLIKIYPPQPVMKLIQYFFFQKFCLNSSLKQLQHTIVCFFNNPWRLCVFTNDLSLCIVLEIYWTKNLLWASLGALISIPASKSL